MKECQKGQKKIKGDLCDMYLENIYLSKEYENSLEEIYFITHDSFESDLQHVGYFYSIGPNSRE